MQLNTFEVQRKFARICRTGTHEEIPGLNADRTKVYRRLIRGVFNDTLIRAYPITYSFLDQRLFRGSNKSAWEHLIDTFLAESDSIKSPQLWKMPQDLLHFVMRCGYVLFPDLTFLEDLLLLEWIEIEMAMIPEREVRRLSPGNLILNPDHSLLHFKFPVFRKKPSDIGAEQGSYFVVCFRERVTYSVRFIEISPLHVLILNRIEDEGVSLGEITNVAIDYLSMNEVARGQHSRDAIAVEIKEFVTLLMDEGLILVS